MSLKELTLSKLNDKELLELARSVSDIPVKDNTTRSALIRILKESVSAEEVRKKVKESRHRQIAADTFHSLLPLKISIVLISMGFLAIAFASFYYSYQYSYLTTQGLYTGEAWLALTQATQLVNFVGVILRTIGVMLLVYWLILSAFRISSENHTAAAILIVGSAIILFGILINFQFVIYLYPRLYY